MLLPILSSRRARLDVRSPRGGGGKSGGSSSSPHSPDDAKSLPDVPDPSTPTSGSGSGSSSGTGTGTSTGTGTTVRPPPASSSSSSSASTKSASTPIIFVNGEPVPLLAIILPIIIVFLILFIGSLAYFYRKARKSGTPPRHGHIFLRALLIATFLWIPVYLVKLALSAYRRRQHRGTLIVAGDTNAAYSKLDDSGGPTQPMMVARTPSPADSELLGMYGRYAPAPPPVGIVVVRPAAMPGRYEPFTAPPPYEGPRTGGGAAAVGGAGTGDAAAGGEVMMSGAGGRSATAGAEIHPLAGPGRVR